MRALEAIGLAAVFSFLPEILSPGDAAAFDPHPGWLAVLVLSARYGSAGFFGGMAAAAALGGLGAAIAGAGSPWGGLGSERNLMLLGACLIVSWIGSSHNRRQADLQKHVRDERERASEAEATVRALREAALALRSRAERALDSLTLLRDIASRLDGCDPAAAAEAAADLALIRTRASAVAVTSGEGESHRLWAFREASGHTAATPATLRDADRSVPMHHGSTAVGAIDLWDIPQEVLNEQTLHDLSVIAAWCGQAIAAAAPAPEAAPDPVLEVS